MGCWLGLWALKTLYFYHCKVLKKYKNKLRGYFKDFWKKLWKKIILGTSDDWSLRRSSHRPINPAYYIEDCRIYKPIYGWIKCRQNTLKVRKSRKQSMVPSILPKTNKKRKQIDLIFVRLNWVGCFKSARNFICQKVQNFSGYVGKIHNTKKIKIFFINV